MSVSFAVMHAGWLPERRASLGKLLPRLPESAFVRVSPERQPVRVYARDTWVWASQQLSDLVVVLNDDALVCLDFEQVVQTLAEAAPGKVLGLCAAGEQARVLFREGHNWIHSYYATGPGYAMSPAQFERALAFWDAHPDIHDVYDDVVASLWLYAEKTPAWLPLPSPVHHDLRLESVLWPGKAIDQTHRKCNASWLNADRDMVSPETWAGAESAPFCENPWLPLTALEKRERARESGTRSF